jgi:hypothetical protein
MILFYFILLLCYRLDMISLPLHFFLSLATERTIDVIQDVSGWTAVLHDEPPAVSSSAPWRAFLFKHQVCLLPGHEMEGKRASSSRGPGTAEDVACNS